MVSGLRRTRIRDSLQEAAAAGNTGWTELHAAASLGYSPIVEKLLANGFNASLKDSLGQTPLHVAGDAVVVEILLRAGATLNVEDREGVTPLYNASFRGDDKVIQSLLDVGGLYAFAYPRQQ